MMANKKVRLHDKGLENVLHPETEAEIVLFGEGSNVETEIEGIKTTLAGLDSTYAKISTKGQANGIASLDSTGKVPSAQLPSYVDDVIEGTYVNATTFNDAEGEAVTPESGKIYVDTTTNKEYRWGGTQYVEISSSLALGETSSTAFPGDRGKALETEIETKQDTLVSGTNIKSVGTQSLLGSGALSLATLANDMGVATTEGLASLTERVDAAEGDIDAIQAKEAGWDAKYAKPEGGIPKTDLASAVQTSLGKADTALQEADIEGYATEGYVGTQIATRQPLDADLTAIAGLTGTAGILKKTGADQWALDATAYATDAELTELEGTVADKADASALSALQTTVDGKADASDLTALEGEVDTLSGTVSGHTSQIGTINTTLGTKADETDLTALESTVNGLNYITFEEIA